MSLKFVRDDQSISVLNARPNIAILPSISMFPADEDIMNVMHRFRPGFIVKNELPSYVEPYAFKHSCFLQSDLAEDVDALTLEDENLDLITERKNCLSVPYVSPNDFQAAYVAEKLTMLIKEVLSNFSVHASMYPPIYLASNCLFPGYM